MNKQGSGLLSGLFVAVVSVMLLSLLGWGPAWTAGTTPHRLAHTPLAGWALALVIGAGLASIWRSRGVARDVVGFVLSGALLGIALTSALFFDAFLAPLLVFAATPVLRASVLGLAQKVHTVQ